MDGMVLKNMLSESFKLILHMVVNQTDTSCLYSQFPDIEKLGDMHGQLLSRFRKEDLNRFLRSFPMIDKTDPAVVDMVNSELMQKIYDGVRISVEEMLGKLPGDSIVPEMVNGIEVEDLSGSKSIQGGSRHCGAGSVGAVPKQNEATKQANAQKSSRKEDGDARKEAIVTRQKQPQKATGHTSMASSNRTMSANTNAVQGAISTNDVAKNKCIKFNVEKPKAMVASRASPCQQVWRCTMKKLDEEQVEKDDASYDADRVMYEFHNTIAEESGHKWGSISMQAVQHMAEHMEDEDPSQTEDIYFEDDYSGEEDSEEWITEDDEYSYGEYYGVDDDEFSDQSYTDDEYDDNMPYDMAPGLPFCTHEEQPSSPGTFFDMMSKLGMVDVVELMRMRERDTEMAHGLPVEPEPEEEILDRAATYDRPAGDQPEPSTSSALVEGAESLSPGVPQRVGSKNARGKGKKKARQ